MVTQYFVRLSFKLCFQHILIHCLACFVRINYTVSLEVQNLTRLDLISQNINHVSNIYLRLKLTADGLIDSLLKHILSKTF